ncbi:putative aliphatic sulfonates transport permease protein SsuC [Oxobacter pfennigii]|uniref:Putative aliphatic sulfonates transport permease protein SsuC n=1 Tax=Oxobacter pfennigii TaxID=36849 RepID=A0A0P8YDJ6_9CLOT|nr:ABC transporter permease subunit [Oxobacter pfennigii]KPU45318.1 putative aliphatic sulfonates transport permease protein SsuC [Oxobacter pfennigii]
MKIKFAENKIIPRLIWIAIILIIWQGISLTGIFSPLILPSALQVLKALYISFINGEMAGQTLLSLILILEGLILGIVLAFVLATLSMLSDTFRGLIDTFISIADPLPGIALLPIIILWAGTGTASILVIIVHSVIWPMILNILAGFKSIPKIYKEIGESYGLKPMGIISSIMIPASLPYLITGTKIGWSRAWRALLSAEMVFGAAQGMGGLGWYIFKNRVFMNTPGMYAGLIVIIAIGIVVEDLIFDRIENITVKRWGMTL